MIRPARTEYYSRLVAENDSYLYYVHSKGYAYRVHKTTNQQIKVAAYMRRKVLFVKINNKEYRLPVLIASLFFSRIYDPTKHVIRYADKNHSNCDANNLIFYTKKEIGIITGKLSHHNRAVVVKEFNKEPIEYSSVRKAAKALYCSYQCLQDYLDGKNDRSILKKWGRRIYYKENTKYA